FLIDHGGVVRVELWSDYSVADDPQIAVEIGSCFGGRLNSTRVADAGHHHYRLAGKPGRSFRHARDPARIRYGHRPENLQAVNGSIVSPHRSPSDGYDNEDQPT